MNDVYGPANYTSGVRQDVQAPAIPFTFEEESKIFRTLRSNQTEEETKCKYRREHRRHRVDIQKLRDEKKLSNDCTIIPDRTIDQNIRAETVSYSKFTQESQWVLAFKDHMSQLETYDPLNNFTTHLFRPPGWKFPWLLASDARLLHGGVALELVFDKTARGFASPEYIRREDLLIPTKTRDIQACMRVGRRYEITKQQFKTLAAKNGFNEGVVKAVQTHYETREEFIQIFKWYMKDDDNTVFIAWFADESVTAGDFLKAPRPHEMGLVDMITPPPPPEQLIMSMLTPDQPPVPPRPVPVPRKITTYPIYLIPYHLEEDETYYETQGRAALDLGTQEAITATMSATVNGSVRAAQLYPTINPGIPQEGVSPDGMFTLKPDHVYVGDYTFAQLPWPNAIALSVVQTLSTRNAQSSGQTDYASMSREDSAKRATELQMAAKEASDLSSVGVSLWSEFQLRLYLDWWEIIKSCIVLGLIQVPPDLAQSGIDLSSPTLTATMAADIQVVKRAETASRLVQFYPLVQGTKFQEPYFETMMEQLFPETVAKWKLSIAQADQQQQMFGMAFQLLSTMPIDDVEEQNRPMFKQLLAGMEQIVKSHAQPQPQSAPSNPAPAMAPGSGNSVPPATLEA